MGFPGIGIAKGMATTFRNFFAPKVTRQYPEERPQMPERWRGRLDLIYDPFGEHKCEVCFQCAQVCPVEAIDMSGFDSQGNRIRYGMPEIYDERKDPNAWRRAGQPARPMPPSANEAAISFRKFRRSPLSNSAAPCGNSRSSCARKPGVSASSSRLRQYFGPLSSRAEASGWENLRFIDGNQSSSAGA